MKRNPRYTLRRMVSGRVSEFGDRPSVGHSEQVVDALRAWNYWT